MIYIIIPDNSKIDYVRGRIEALNWRSYYKNGFFLVRNDFENSRQVLEMLTGDDKLANSVVFKLEDNTQYFYWGYSSEDMWNWLNENSQSPHNSWQPL